MLSTLVHFAQSSNNGDGAAAVAGLGIGLFVLLFWLVMFGLWITLLVLWIISLIHVIQHDDVKDRTMWILIILLVGSIGGAIYFFAVKRSYDKGGSREIKA